MDFDSPDVEKDFPGLYAAEDIEQKEKKDKKDKGKDRGYAALEGESSSEEDLEAKSPSKVKKSKPFKFTSSSSKSKEKREKSRDKEKWDSKESDKSKEKLEKYTEKDRDKDKDHQKKKDKDRKDKKEKIKDKERKDKKDKEKTKQLNENIDMELGLVFPVFGVSISIAVERSRCHDGCEIPLIMRECIDYLQENALKNEQIYRVEPLKTRLLHYKRLYNNRERQPESDELDMPTACGLMKLFLRELPEPVLTTDLIARFEEVASYPEVTEQQQELQQLLDQLPSCNKTLLSWILLHFDCIIQNEKYNKMNAQSLAMLLSPPLQMSHRLLIALLCHGPALFSDVQLIKYVPPLTSTSPNLLENPSEIQKELRKQESLLNQIHYEMNAGFITKRREEQLWEVQRIITQLKRKLRSFEKNQEKRIEDIETRNSSICNEQLRAPTSVKFLNSQHTSDDDVSNRTISTTNVCSLDFNINDIRNSAATIHQEGDFDEDISTKESLEFTGLSPTVHSNNNIVTKSDYFHVDPESGFLIVSKGNPDYLNLIRLQLENQELLNWKTQLQMRITQERAEFVQLKQLYQQCISKGGEPLKNNNSLEDIVANENYENVLEHYIKENALLEHKKEILTKEIREERKQCIALQVEFGLRQLQQIKNFEYK